MQPQRRRAQARGSPDISICGKGERVDDRHDRREQGHECELEIKTGRAAGRLPQEEQENGDVILFRVRRLK